MVRRNIVIIDDPYWKDINQTKKADPKRIGLAASILSYSVLKNSDQAIL